MNFANSLSPSTTCWSIVWLDAAFVPTADVVVLDLNAIAAAVPTAPIPTAIGTIAFPDADDDVEMDATIVFAGGTETLTFAPFVPSFFGARR